MITAALTHSEGCQNTDGVGSTVLDQCPWDHLKGPSNSSVWPLLHSCYTLGSLTDHLCQSHFKCPSSRNKARINHDISDHLHCVLEVSLHLQWRMGNSLSLSLSLSHLASFRMSLLAPLSRMVQALGFLQLTK